jgi:hypothetical protein
MTPPKTKDVVQMLLAGMVDMNKAAATNGEVAQAEMTKLAERVINYFAVHYAEKPSGMLPGLPGGPLAR